MENEIYEECPLCNDFIEISNFFFVFCCKNYVHKECLFKFIKYSIDLRCPYCNTNNFGICGNLLFDNLLIDILENN